MDKRIQKNRIYAACIVGVFFAVLISFTPLSFFVLILTAGTVFFIYHFSNKSERNFLLIIFSVGLGLRIGLTILVLTGSIFSGHMTNYAGFLGCPDYSTPYILDDSAYITLRALFTSMYWQGLPLSKYAVGSVVKHVYGRSAFIYVLAAFFNIFGYSPISSRFINCFLGSLIILLVYSITKNIFNERPARLAAILIAFFPSTFLWSITNLKETSLILTTALTLWSLVKFQRAKSTYFLIIALLSIGSQSFIRFSYRIELLLLNFTAVFFYFFYLSVSNLVLKKRMIVLLLIFMIGSGLIFSGRGKISSTIKGMVNITLIQHRGAINTGGKCYKLLPEKYYKGSKSLNAIDSFKMLARGWFHIIFEPLPWRIQSKAMLFSFAQMALWYLLIPFAILGALISVRYRLRESIILMIYFVLMTSALAVTGGNIGTIFRFRDINTPIVLIFSSIGLFTTFRPFGLKLNKIDRVSV